jgi:hypothetical protein
MTNLVFLLEELSAKVLLEGLLPRVLPMDRFVIRYVPFEGKQDLHKQLVRKIRNWRAPDTKFIVLRDQDSANCKTVKQALADLCFQAGRPDTIVRVACREIESWYLGDLVAVEAALELENLQRWSRKPKNSQPDLLQNPSATLERLTGGVYQKVSGSRAIGRFLDVEGRNRSHSFGLFISAMAGLVDEPA